LLNYFGTLGGFDALLEIVWQNKVKPTKDTPITRTPLSLIYRIAQFFFQLKQFFNKPTI